jgi:phosphomevalonate kinase
VSQRWQSSAPGKLVLAGEYSVLEGGAAVSVAAGVRANARLSAAEGSTCELVIDPGNESFPFSVAPSGALVWENAPGASGALLQAASGLLQEQGVALTELAPFRLALCSREFYRAIDGQQVKLGLGSSAAVAVALGTCLQQALGHAVDVQFSLDIHHRFQQQRGSGIDVYTSFHGGVVALRERTRITPLNWPAGLQVVPVWTGTAAATPTKLVQLAEFAASSNKVYSRLMQAMKASSSAIVASWTAASTADVLLGVAEFAHHLRALDEAAGIGIWSRMHNELAQLAASCDLVYKPSGAGGGDFGCVFGADTQAVADFTLQAESAGYSTPAFDLQAAGWQAD